jgi:hypothetical protein
MAETITYEVGGIVQEPKSAWITITDSLGRKLPPLLLWLRSAQANSLTNLPLLKKCR